MSASFVRLIVPLVGIAVLSAHLPAHGQGSVSKFYKGKKVRLIISSSPGGGYDSYGRLLAEHMGRYVPGRPTIVPENMRGKGGLKAANYVYNKAPRDGTVIAGIQRQVPLNQILGDKRAKFIASRFNWLGSLNNEVTICVSWHTSKVKSFADLKKYPLVIGGSGPNDTETVPALLNNKLGTNFDIVTGFDSSTSITIAIELGQVEGTCGSYSSLSNRNADWFRNRKINILVQSSTRKHPNLKHVPLALDLAKDRKTRQLMALNDARLEIGRPYLAPPSVPAIRVQALRNAFARTVVDKKFLAGAKKRKRAISPVSGQDVQALIRRVSKVNKKMIANLKDALKYKAKKAAAKIEMNEITGPVKAIKLSGRHITVEDEDEEEDYSAKVSPTRTLITIAGRQASPARLKLGMKCTITSLGSGLEATNVDCK